MLEHRFFTRYKVEGEVLIQFKGQGKTETVRAELVDMSFRGCGIYSPRALEQAMMVNFFISGKLFQKHMRGEARVMYSQAYKRANGDVHRVGLEFISVDSDQVRDVIMLFQDERDKAQARGKNNP
jgi:c-di-GMP-binding flagellar brake protein YcgR